MDRGMQGRLPSKLGKNPIIDAVFEIRFKPKALTSNILPGIIFTKFTGEKQIENLPIAQLPEPVRRDNPSLRYAPLSRVHWDEFAILSGDYSAGLGCKLPYPGWISRFKPTILTLLNTIKDASIVETVERFSLKYTNILSGVGDGPDVVDFSLSIGPYKEHDTYQVRTELRRDDFIVILQLSSHATATLPDSKTIEGPAIDIDTIYLTKDISYIDFLQIIEDKLERAHLESKSIFFDCLKPEALQKLEPEYD